MIDQGTKKPRTANHVLQKANPKLEQDGNYMPAEKVMLLFISGLPTIHPFDPIPDGLGTAKGQHGSGPGG